jgi:hypothetical protein
LMRRAQRDGETIAYFAERDLPPCRVVHRHDETVELTWRVDDCYERYVRVTSSVRGDEHVLVCRDLRTVAAAVLDARGEIFDWVRTHLQRLREAFLNRLHGTVSQEGVAGGREVGEVPRGDVPL